ncbi:hypothetical protein [Methylobacterium sp. SD21]|uniref:hypothetical protein n=1 Tax=Methylobacterium litchii TaxID=3138810 RepID=UPI00313C17FB
MIDPAILLSLDARMPPEPPTMVVEERIALDALGEEFLRIGMRLADTFDADAERYIEAMQVMPRQLDGAKASGVGSADEIAKFTQAISDLERVADMRVRRAGKAKKTVERQAKVDAKHSPSLALARRKVAARVFATDQRLIEALLDYTTFIRALRSEIDPANQGAPTFSDAASLRDHLARLGAV